MYCIKCGKEILDERNTTGVCKSCSDRIVWQSIQNAAEPTNAPKHEGNPRMRGFGIALTGALVSVVGFILSVFMFLAVMIGLYYSDLFIYVILIGALLAIPLIAALALPIVFGVMSIVKFVKAKDKKPIATLILGIAAIFTVMLALGFAAVAAFFILLVLFFAIMLILFGF